MEFNRDFYRGKKVFVTGHTGFKGSWLCKMLSNLGAEVTGYSLEPPTSPSIFEIANIESDVKSYIGDIRDLVHLKKVFDETQILREGFTEKEIKSIGNSKPLFEWSEQEYNGLLERLKSL